MSELIAMWLPILVSAVAVFIASSIAWTALPHHKPDYRKLPNEDGLLEYVRGQKVPPGQYIFPYCEPKDMKDEQMKQRYYAGPHGVINVWPAVCSMGRNLALTFLFFLVASVFVAYITSAAISGDAGASYLDVFQIAGTAAILAYCFAFIPNAIWFGKPGRAVLMDIIDGIAYSLITAGVFGWLAV